MKKWEKRFGRSTQTADKISKCVVTHCLTVHQRKYRKIDAIRPSQDLVHCKSNHQDEFRKSYSIAVISHPTYRRVNHSCQTYFIVCILTGNGHQVFLYIIYVGNWTYALQCYRISIVFLDLTSNLVLETSVFNHIYMDC